MQGSGEMCDAPFWKIANRAFIACAGKFFGKVPGKFLGEIVLGKIQKIFFVCEKFSENSLKENPCTQFKFPQ